MNAVEINSSFYRPHRPQTYARWADSVPDPFRFSVKLPKIVTHEQRLQDCEESLDMFLSACGHLGAKLGCLLVQLPPSLTYDEIVVQRFFACLRERYLGPVAVEPRHASWAQAQALLVEFQVAQVAASPSRFERDAQPGGWPGLAYWRLHGEPRIYHSAYDGNYLDALAHPLKRRDAAQLPSWCIFDNTASGAALGDALAIQRLLSA